MSLTWTFIKEWIHYFTLIHYITQSPAKKIRLKKRIKTGLRGWSGFGIGVNCRCTLSVSNSPPVSILRPLFRIFWTQVNRVPLVPKVYLRPTSLTLFRLLWFFESLYAFHSASTYFWHYCHSPIALKNLPEGDAMRSSASSNLSWITVTVAFNSPWFCLIVEKSVATVDSVEFLLEISTNSFSRLSLESLGLQGFSEVSSSVSCAGVFRVDWRLVALNILM